MTFGLACCAVEMMHMAAVLLLNQRLGMTRTDWELCSVPRLDSQM
jgi:NADH:ubiquinone oxidoreductase subunit B-like Fe-S oxidoreductase